MEHIYIFATHSNSQNCYTPVLPFWSINDTVVLAILSTNYYSVTLFNKATHGSSVLVMCDRHCLVLATQHPFYFIVFLSDFFIRLDQECGPLTLHSSLKDLVNYTRKGLESIEQDRQTTADLLCGIPSSADSFR